MNCIKEKTKHREYLFDLSCIIIFTIAFNFDWRSSSILWWGSIVLFIISIVIHEKGKIHIDNKYTIWVVSFLSMCGISIIWASSKQLVITIMTGMIVNLGLLFFMRSRIHDREEVQKVTNIILIAITINMVYLLVRNSGMVFNFNIDKSGNINRLGTEEGWNSNSIGMMASFGFIILFYLFQVNKMICLKLLYGINCALIAYIALETGSRKAFITLISGSTFYMLLNSKGKRIRTILIITIIISLFYYIAFEIPYFYSVIGWRLDGAFAQLTGVGNVDHSAMIRSEFIKAGLHVFYNHPVLGVGIDCFRDYNFNLTGYDWYAHNNYVEILADLGIIGFTIYYLGYIYLFKCFWSRYKEDLFTKFLFAIFFCILLDGYCAVIFSDFLFQTIIMLMFAWFSNEISGDKNNV